ncbi:MAG: hypothetical protein R2877_05970 [Bdellovibrionota bacterium]
MYNKKTWCFLLSLSFLMPSAAFARGRDIAMAVSGAVILGAGITFVIKSGKNPPNEPSTSRVEIKTWNPMTATTVNHDPLRR